MEPISFLGGTLLGAGAAFAARRLQTSPRPDEGLGDLLGWAFLIEEGIILMKDGSFLAGATLVPPDLATASAPEVNRAAAMVNEALMSMGEGFSLEVNVHRTSDTSYPYPRESAFSTPALTAMEAERRQRFSAPGKNYVTRCSLLVTYTPPKEHWARWETVVVRGSSPALDYRQVLKRFKHRWAELITLLGSVFTIHPMSSEDLVTECHKAVTGLPEPLQVSAIPHSYLSYALAPSDFETGFYPVLGGSHLFLCTITSLGTSTQCLAGEFINRLTEEGAMAYAICRHEPACIGTADTASPDRVVSSAGWTTQTDCETGGDH